MQRIITCLFFLFVSLNVIKSQTISMAWQKCLGGSAAETFNTMLQTPDGGMIFLGTTKSNDGDVSGNHLQSGGNPSVDYWVVKVNSNGVIQWQKCLGGSSHEQSTPNMILTPDGGVLVFGQSSSNDGDAVGNHGNGDGFVAKLSGTGTLLWAKCVGGSLADDLKTAVVTPAGNYVLAGTTESNNGDVSGNHGSRDMWLVELAATTGSLIWQKCYGGTAGDELVDLESAQNNGYLFCGNTVSANGDVTGNTGSSDAWLVRVDLTGNIAWQKCYNAVSNQNYQNDFAFGIVPTAGGYQFIYANKEEPYFQLFSSYRQEFHRTYAGTIDIGNGSLSGVTLLNANDPTGQLFYPPETNWYAPNALKPKMGGGLLLANKMFTCLMYDNYGYSFPPVTSRLINQSFNKYVNSSGLQKSGQGFLAPQCPSGIYPLPTYNGIYTGYDVTSLNESTAIDAGSSSAKNRPLASQYGSYDAMLGIQGGNYSYWGGSGDDVFQRVSQPDSLSFFCVGATNSNNGHVTGNHGQDDIWLVQFSFLNATIKGAVFNDLNGNGIKEAGESLRDNQPVKTTKPGVQIISYTQNGAFNHFVDTGNYTTQIVNNYPYTVLTPAQKNSVLGNYNTTDSFGLGMRTLPGVKDLQVYLSAENPPRPGFNITYHLQYKNFGTDLVNNTQVYFIKDPRSSFVSASLPGYTQNGDTLSWNTGTRQPGSANDIRIVLNIAPPPTVNINDTLSAIAMILPLAGDTLPADNTLLNRLVVRGSYDPNDKTNQHGDEVGRNYLVNGGYLYYRIRFQNTGTDTAFTVKINDSLNAALDVNTLEMLEASHNYSLRVVNQVAYWQFRNILLPDSITNPDASQGYIFFRIKPLAASISAGRVYTNTASIYFDFNESVRTNTDQVKIKSVRKPVIGSIAGNYCKNTTGNVTGKVTNPLSSYTVNVWVDNTPVAYQPADSSFNFNIPALANGDHTLKVKFSEFDVAEDSTTLQFSVDTLLIPQILIPDTTVCANGNYLNMYTNMPVNQWLGGFVTIAGNWNYLNTGFIGAVNQLIAIKNNGACPQGRDTLMVNGNFFVQPQIITNDTSVCISSPVFNLVANTSVTWNGPGVSGSTFNAALASAGTHQIMAVKDNGKCPAGTDVVTIVVTGQQQVVINNPNTTVCKLSPPVTLTANLTGVTWAGPGVSGIIFNPSVAGVGIHNIIATKTNGTCPDSKDTLVITVEDFVQAIIATPDQTVCTLSSPISLLANTTVTWSGNGVSGSTFNPAVAGNGTHQIIATKNNSGCPDTKDTLIITVQDFIPVIISTPDQTICKLAAPINLSANTPVTWSGNGVSGSTFNPATAGPGTHQVIAATLSNGCPVSKDTLNITVDDFVQAVITTPDQTVCRISSLINLQANTTVTWSGNGVSGSTFNPATAGVGTHQIIATKNNGSCPVSKDTLNITVDDFIQTVISTPDQTVCKLSTPINLTANTSVTWSGNGVSGSTFNPAIAGTGTHQVIATHNNSSCPASKDTLNITVDDFVQAVIATPDQTICKLAAPINLVANTSVTWSGNGVSGSTFNPATAGVGTHQIIATKNNGSCPVSKDTLNITVNDFIRPVIGNNDTVVCASGSSFGLRANMAVTWSGNGVSGSTFNPATTGAGTHLVIASRTNGSCPDGKDTLIVTVQPLLTPDVNITASQSSISTVSGASLLTATNAAAGGTAPLYTFAQDRNFTQVLRAESAANTFTVTQQMLSVGSNMIYVRMRSNASCIATNIAVDSLPITLTVNTPPESELEKALKVFPNPNNGQFAFRFETGINDNVSVIVFNGTGKEVYQSAFGHISQYSFAKILNLRNQAGGRYIVQLKVGNQILTRVVHISR